MNSLFSLLSFLSICIIPYNILYINLKAKPEIVAILKEEYPNIITSAWHMNKIHWFKVDVNNIESDVLDALIKQSFDITATKKQKI